ncbi:MAG TPA: hypothetical protein ENJ95_01435 [Bacteroidetes bacterium]|nr:hypothetical protein [Bacteroidota bacterium]
MVSSYNQSYAPSPSGATMPACPVGRFVETYTPAFVLAPAERRYLIQPNLPTGQAGIAAPLGLVKMG